MRNSLEGVPESHPTKDVILELMRGFKEGGVVNVEKSDEQGPYLIEVRFEEDGEVFQLEYMRKGSFSSHNSAGTSINVVYYNGDIPCGGNNLFDYNYETLEWKRV